MLKKRLFKPYIYFLSKKPLNNYSIDFYIKNVYGFLKFKCYWNFNNLKSYFNSFNIVLKKKKNLIEEFNLRYSHLF